MIRNIIQEHQEPIGGPSAHGPHYKIIKILKKDVNNQNVFFFFYLIERNYRHYEVFSQTSSNSKYPQKY